MPPIAELTFEGVGAGVIGTGIVAVVIGFALFERFQSGRKAIVDELKRELRAEEEPQTVEVQSPLSIKEHIEYTPITDHLRLAQDFRDHCEAVDRRFLESAQASSASRQKIYELIRDQTEKSAALVRETSSKVDQVSGQVTVLNQQLQQISTTLLRKS